MTKATSRRSDSGPEVTEDLLVPAVGAVIFASDEPVKPAEIAAILGNVELGQVKQAIAELERQYAEIPAGLQLESIAGGFRLATRADVGPWVRRFFQQRNRTRLTPAALETLAIVAYRQPVTGPEIQAIRGKDPGAALKSLLDKGMIRILGKKKVVGNPLLYGTSKQFLVHFGLNGLADLPSIDEFDEFVGALDSDQGRLFTAGPTGDEEVEVDVEDLAEDADAPDGEGDAGPAEPSDAAVGAEDDASERSHEPAS